MKPCFLRKALFCLSFLLTLYLISYAQGKTYVYYLDENLQSVPKKKAVIEGRGVQAGNYFMMHYTSLVNKKLFWIASYTDSALTVQQGNSLTYHLNGKRKEYAFYNDNKLNGSLVKWDSLGRVTDSARYENDHLLYGVENNYYYDSTNLLSRVITDSIQNTLSDIDYDSLGNKTREVFFVGNKGIWKEYNTDGSVSSADSVFTREIKEASFPGNWAHFLEKNLDGQTIIRHGAASGSGRVIIQFIVNADGSLSNIKALTNIGYGAEEEAIRVIKLSKKWVPANAYGKPVKAYRKQPITFAVMER